MPRGRVRKGGKCSKTWNRAHDKKDSDLTESDKDNAKLWEYYKRLGIIPEAEWDAFVESLKTELPSAFRIQGCHNSWMLYAFLVFWMGQGSGYLLHYALESGANITFTATPYLPFYYSALSRERDAFVKMMKYRFFSKIEEDVHVPKQLPWLDCAFQTKMSRAAAQNHPILKQLHDFLVTEGETVSVPTVSSLTTGLGKHQSPRSRGHDSCSAAGRQASPQGDRHERRSWQQDDADHREDARRQRRSRFVPVLFAPRSSHSKEGILVVNDADGPRCSLILKRVLTANCVVIGERAAVLPAMKDSSGNTLFFDRVLCDVLCSGDGTFRKNVELWESWSPQIGLSLHRRQVNTARRSLEMLAVGGLMVYSTCSLNPIEDEAVLTELLRLFEGTVELVDVSDKLPGLERSPGISEWKVMDRELEAFSSYAEVPGRLKRPILPTMFPPSKEEAERYHLERSFRVLPHTQDTGGFFVAVLTKKAHLHPKTDEVAKPSVPFMSLAKEDEHFQHISDFYGINSSFPTENLLSPLREKALYFVNSAVREFLQQNQERVNVVHAGVKMFRRQRETMSSDCKFRLSRDVSLNGHGSPSKPRERENKKALGLTKKSLIPQ
uniref:tRNA (cytosine(34)-C(5))-methyltransferase n=1 Tax=Steinernema glaseri TaxID=37863 RepID=A0A1I7YAR6_9BILA